MRHLAVVENRRIARTPCLTRFERCWAWQSDCSGDLNGKNGLNLFKCVGKIDRVVW